MKESMGRRRRFRGGPDEERVEGGRESRKGSSSTRREPMRYPSMLSLFLKQSVFSFDVSQRKSNDK
jgi:hypothetical protein